MRKVRDLTGLTDRRIRYYEQRGMLGPVDRTPTNQRIYEGRQIRQLWEIADYRDMDLRLREIDALLDSGTTRRNSRIWPASMSGRRGHSVSPLAAAGRWRPRGSSIRLSG
jgi:MerR family glutamine synthetase transcriptional repressor